MSLCKKNFFKAGKAVIYSRGKGDVLIETEKILLQTRADITFVLSPKSLCTGSRQICNAFHEGF